MTTLTRSVVALEASTRRSRLGARLFASLPDLVTCALAGFAVPAMVLLLAGWFSPGWVLPIGVLGAALAVAVCGAGPDRVDAHTLRCTLIAIALVLVWCVVNSMFSAENLYAHRDPATYNLAGRWLVDHATLHIPTQADVFGSPAGGSGQGAGFSSSSATQLYAQGNHLLPALLGVTGWLFGTTALLKANVAFGALALLAFFALARRMVNPPLALVAMVAFGVSLPLIYVSRDTYSEPLALLFLVGGLGLLHRAVDSGRVREFALAGFVLACSALARIDSTVSLLAVVVSAAAFPMFASRARLRTAVRRALALVAGMVVPNLVGWLDVTHLSFGYYRDERHNILPVFELGGALLIVLPLLVWASWHPVVRRVLRTRVRQARELTRTVTIGAVVLIGGGFVFLASRPLWLVARGDTSYAGVVVTLQLQAEQAVDSTRTYDERTVQWLAAYLGWPAVILGAIGYILLVRRCARTRSLASVGAITVGLAMSLLYLWTAMITPDQPWAMRRYVPVVMPIMIIAATYTCCVAWHLARAQLARRQLARGQLARGAWPVTLALRAGVVAACAALIVIPAVVTAPLATAREEVPQLTQVARICAAVGARGAVLSVDVTAQTSYLQTIRSYCNVPSYFLFAPTPAQLVKVRAAVSAHQRVLYLLATIPERMHFAGPAPAAPFSEVTTTRWPSVLNAPPVAAQLRTERVPVYLATVRADGRAQEIPAPR